ncbi:MAG: orotate phosphoribosyltransferase [Rhizobiales bacterium TMED28]|nr:orotate phosphoribosyltransferase [Rhodobiaceae bacterium]OUT82672.1 MAG: orotate phosphoribosyltransferase [Rhizobiales bacterium TMED28]|tara:strand:- start:53 stop:634 length:582 start_codon:yes stop_codon:yes gene_type:complete
MSQDDILGKFIEAGALLDGHFVLSSGLHSAKYIQCARVMMFPKIAQFLCKELAKKITETFGKIDLIVSPAMGGVIVGYEVAKQLGVPSIFFERVEGQFQLRRGFQIEKQTKCVMVEDIVTTGLSSRECISAITSHDGNVMGAACLIDRSSGNANVGVNLVSLSEITIETYEEINVPAWLNDIPISKPGSRNLK